MIAFDLDQTLLAPPLMCGGSDPTPFGARNLRRHIADVTSNMVNEIRVGDAVYRLRHPITLTFYPYVLGGQGEMVPDDPEALDDSLNFVGRGETAEEAFADWSAQLHTQIQTLLAKRDWEKSTEELDEVAAIERMIDMPAYLRDTPYRVRQIGTVIRRRPVPDRVRWEDGTVEHVNLDQMPPEFAALHAGQRFEALAVRSPGTGRLQRVVYVSPLPALRPVPAENWEKLPTTASTSPMSWDEID